MNRLTSLRSRLAERLLAVPLNLRGKLLLANVVIVLVALAAMGIYVFARAQQANAYLGEQLDASVIQQGQANLQGIAAGQAAVLDEIFAAVAGDLHQLSVTSESLLANPGQIGLAAAWDPTENLTQLPSGDRDNENDETGSVYVPARTRLTGVLLQQLSSLRQMDFVAPIILETYPEVVAVYFGGRYGEVIHYPNIDYAATVGADFDVRSQPWYTQASPERNPEREVTWTAPHVDPTHHGLVVTGSVPVYDAAERFRGAAAIDVQLLGIVDTVHNLRVGQTGSAFLLDAEGRLIAEPREGVTVLGLPPRDPALEGQLGEPILGEVPLGLFNTIVSMTMGQTGVDTVELSGTEYLIGFRPLPTTGYSLGLIAPASEVMTASAYARQQIRNLVLESVLQSSLLVLAVLVLSIGATYLVARGLTSPLESLTAAARKVSAGDLEARAEVRTKDEISELATTLNTMTGTLRGMIGTLEQRVAERTADLDAARKVSEKRARDMMAVAEISSLITSEQELDSLLPLTTQLVSDRFGFYHTGVFLVDVSGRYAVLKAANSPGGQRMLARGHRLEVGVTGIVGQVAHGGKPRIALDVGEDPIYFDNPDLPQTRSEMALPLNSRGRTIGVLDVQSTEPGAFTTEDASNLTILADQIAASIENASLYGATQEALAEARTLYTQYLQKGWQDYAEQEFGSGYLQEAVGGHRLEQAVDSPEIRRAFSEGQVAALEPTAPGERPRLLIPVRLRGQVIGVMNIQGAFEGRGWREDEVEIAQQSADRLALAIENARLLQDSQRRAAKERTIGEITGKISATMKTSQILETATSELQNAIPRAVVSIRLHQPGDPSRFAPAAPEPGIKASITLRGEELGIILVRAPEGVTVKPDQMDLIYAVAERVALSLENARLFEETTRRAQRERMVGEITTKIRSTNDPQEMIRTAIMELRDALGVSRVDVIPGNNGDDVK